MTRRSTCWLCWGMISLVGMGSILGIFNSSSDTSSPFYCSDCSLCINPRVYRGHKMSLYVTGHVSGTVLPVMMTTGPYSHYMAWLTENCSVTILNIWQCLPRIIFTQDNTKSFSGKYQDLIMVTLAFHKDNTDIHSGQH